MVLERELKQMTEKAMYDHGLIQDGWKFAYGRGKKTFGTCSFGKKEIRISKHLARVNTPERVKMTILHEIAHALVGRFHGHDAVWKAKCIEIGGNGERCYSSENTVCLESNRQKKVLKTATIHHKEFKAGDPIKFRNNGVCTGEFYEYRPSNHKYPVMVKYGNTIYKMSTRSVIG